MTGIELRLLGGFECRGPDGALLEVGPRKARALLAYLGFQLGKLVPRAQLSSLVWGDISADEQARRSLRQALTTLRRALPEAALETRRDELMLCPSARVDVLRFEHLARQHDRAALERALELYRGELLEGFLAQASGFDAWLERERKRLTSLAADALQRLCELEREQGDATAAMATAMRLVATDPVREAAHRALMQLYADAGRASEAVRQFNVLREVLAEKLSTTPDAQTTDLLERIRRSSGRRQPPEARLQVAATGAPELRQVCVLAVAVADGSFDLALEREVEVILSRFGGSLARVAEQRAFGVFGFPRAHGDDLERGVRAALALCGLDSLAGRVTIGVAAGPLLVEQGSGSPALKGAVLGRAGELSQEDGHGVLVTGAVARALGERLESRPARRELDASWVTRCLDPAERPYATPLVGRRYELSQLDAALELCAGSRRGRTIVVRGEAGIGKTRLVRELGEAARRRGFSVHARAFADFGDATQGPPVQGIVRELLAEQQRDFPASSPPSSPPSALKDLDDSDLVSLLEMVREVGREDARSEPGGRALFLRRRRAAACRLLAQRSLRAPRLLVLEDLHWADAEALAQIGAWIDVAAAHALLLVVTTRLEAAPESLLELTRGRPVTTLDLAPLAPDEARELIHAVEPEADQDAELVLARAGGNPLFIEQLLRLPQPNGVPATISSLVLARTDQLETEERAVLQAASVLGQSFTLPALAQLLERDEPSLDRLLALSLISERGDGYAFVHALVRDAVYEAVPPERRTRMHLGAARYYAGRDAGLQAEHLDRAGDDDAAAAYVRAAAVEQRAGNLERALTLCLRARELSAHAGERHASALLHGELCLELGRSEAALEAFTEAEASASDASGRARSLIGRASALRILDRSKEALLALAPAERLLDPQREPVLLSRIHYLRGNVLFPLGDWAACLKSQTLALEGARRTGSTLAEAQALSGIADAHYLAGRWQTARTFFARCEQVARQAGALDLELTSRNMQHNTQVYALELPPARDGCLEVAERARAAGSLRTEALARVSAAWSLLALGDWEATWSEARRAVEIADEIGAQRFSALGLAYGAIARSELGERGAAQSDLERALELARASSLRFAGPTVYAALLAVADADRVPALLEEADDMIGSGGFGYAFATFGMHGVPAALKRGELDRVARYAGEIERGMREEPHPLGALLVDFARTLAAWFSDPRAERSRRELARVRAAVDAARLKPLLLFVDRFAREVASTA